MSNIVAVVGRPNVGKSTLFNRLTQTRQAIVDEFSGVTRDRHYGKVEWNGQIFSLIDTGGYVQGSDDVFEAEIRKQVDLAIEEANLIIFVVDVISGITDLDESVARVLRKIDKPTLVAVNKVDNGERLIEANEFYGLGMGEFFPISSINGSGTGELLDAVTSELPPIPDELESGLPRFTLIGRPNVGKSSMLNALLGKEKNIVTDIAGTTRDSLDVEYNMYGHHFIMVDTAGIRRKKKVAEDLEFYSVMRSIRAIENSDVCIIMLDATRTLDAQDINIFHLAQKNEKGIVVLVNKWDLVEKETNTIRDIENQIRKRTAPFSDFPIVFTSALTKQRIHKALDEAMKVYERKTTKISTSKLNDFFLPVVNHTPPPATKGKYIKIKYVTQLPTAVPSFAFFCNLPQYIKDPYKRFLENKLRDHFNFSGVPVRFFFRKK
ncbi:MAG: ribosome biogenesis GTPase Der [Flavobacteriales bacterium]|jgi:GTP-binding protein|nr:ribosome biogenesis GTPase Der [Flavobacteriales bacterium]